MMSTPKKSPVMVWVNISGHSWMPPKLVKISIDDLPEGIECYPEFAVVRECNDEGPSKSEG